MDVTTINSIMDRIPEVIVFLRNAITNILSMINLQEYFPLTVLGIAFFLAYLWMKQFITQSLWLKLSTLLNLLLLALLIFVTLTYVR